MPVRHKAAHGGITITVFCQYCGCIITGRVLSARNATCFSCKRQKNLKRQEEYRKLHERKYRRKRFPHP